LRPSLIASVLPARSRRVNAAAKWTTHLRFRRLRSSARVGPGEPVCSRS
jgi:hypothetical protein